MGPEVYNSDNYVVVDFEIDTSHGDYGHAVWPDNGLLLASWRVAGQPVQSSWNSEFSQDKLLRDVEAADFIVAHNAKYELGWLKRCGLDITEVIVFDTQIAEYVLLGNLAAGCETTGLPGRSISLEACRKRRGLKVKDPVVDLLMKQDVNPKDMPRPWLQGRCESDVTSTEQLFLDQRPHLERTGRLPVLYTRCMLTPVLAAIEFEGMTLDAERVEKEYREHKRLLKELSLQFEEMAQGINWKSPLQVANFLYAPEPEGMGFEERKGRDGRPRRTASGRPKADKDTIASLVGKTKRQKSFLELRTKIGKVQAAVSKSLEFFHGICNEYDSRFYATFNQCNTATHRLSSSGHKYWIDEFQKKKTTQFQNMPRVFKPLFTAETEGNLMVEVDGSQLEFRVAAELGRDRQALADITDPDFDAHCTSASIINGIPYDEFLQAYRSGDKKAKALRTAAKVDTFKPLYGGESGNKGQKAYYKAFKQRYSGLAAMQESWVEQVMSNDQRRLTTPWGMRYYWPRAKRSPFDGYVNVKNPVYNYPVQAFATAEIIPIALCSLFYRTRDLDGVRILNTVHDSVILEVPPQHLDAVREAAIKSFGMDVYEYLETVYNFKFHVPLGCGITVGKHWSEGAEESYNIWPDGRREKVA